MQLDQKVDQMQLQINELQDYNCNMDFNLKNAESKVDQLTQQLIQKEDEIQKLTVEVEQQDQLKNNTDQEEAVKL